MVDAAAAITIAITIAMQRFIKALIIGDSRGVNPWEHFSHLVYDSNQYYWCYGSTYAIEYSSNNPELVRGFSFHSVRLHHITLPMVKPTMNPTHVRNSAVENKSLMTYTAVEARKSMGSTASVFLPADLVDLGDPPISSILHMLSFILLRLRRSR